MTSSIDNGSEPACDVLVIDDEEDVLDLLLPHLLNRGICAKGMTSGKDLADIIARNPPRIVLLDVLMPMFNGYLLHDAIKDASPNRSTRVYFISALPEEDLSRHVKRSGAAGFIAKPFTFADIDAVLASNGIIGKSS